MKSQLFIPEKIKVGFNPRNDTYTGLLGYVIYHDGKVWRKESSWEGWRYKYQDGPDFEKIKRQQFDSNLANMRRGSWYTKEAIEQFENSYETFKPSGKFSDDKKIIPLEFENKPMEGFVLNKKAGGYSSGWNHRATYCRVYDPRGFEFEISVPNLLFILQETSSYKGKGLEGEFVYAWEGKDLVLLPAHCEEYQQSAKYTKLQDGKVVVKDLIPGCTYQTKKQVDLVYLGKFNWYSLENVSGRKWYDKVVSTKKYQIFVNLKAEGNNRYVILTTLTSLAGKTSETEVSNYAELMDEFSKSRYASKPIGLESEPTELKFKSDYDELKNTYWLDKKYYIKKSDSVYVSYSILVNYTWTGAEKIFKGYYLNEYSKISFEKDKLLFESINNYSYNSSEITHTKEQLEALEFVELYVNLESGSKVLAAEY